MKIPKVFALSVAILSIVIVTRASVPIIIATPGRMVSAMKRVTDAQDQLQKGDAAAPRFPLTSASPRTVAGPKPEARMAPAVPKGHTAPCASPSTRMLSHRASWERRAIATEVKGSAGIRQLKQS